jgi:hypothetical protein
MRTFLIFLSPSLTVPSTEPLAPVHVQGEGAEIVDGDLQIYDEGHCVVAAFNRWDYFTSAE